MAFPITRLRRLRQSLALRRLVRETTLDAGDFVMPLFVRPGKGEKRAIKSMPGQFQYSVDELVKAAGPIVSAGIPGVILFGIPDKEDSSLLKFEDIAGISENDMRVIYRAITPTTLASALKTAPPEITNKFFDNMKPHMVGLIKEVMHKLGEIPGSQIEAERDNILKVIEILRSESKIK